MEAGNRCYDDRVPEEVNRRIIDHSSDILMPYTERSRQNLLREGIAGERIFVTGNPIWEVIEHYDPMIRQSSILSDLHIEPQGYMLVTLHRAENVDIEERLRDIAATMEDIQKTYGLPIIVSTHPHTQARLKDFGIAVNNERIRFLPPFGFFDFITLERNARCVLSDSGTVQEECCLFRVANVTLRDVTERPETLECGSNILSGADPAAIMRCIAAVADRKPDWTAPPEYLAPNVSDTVVKILMGYFRNQSHHA
jgi:UDP-N-acetylglucosamine 2-epimerase (non-hydrolysing)